MNRGLDYHIWLQVNTFRDPEIQGKAVGTNKVEVMAITSHIWKEKMTNWQIQVAENNKNWINLKKSTPRHIIVKLLEIKEKVLKQWVLT